MIPPNNTTTTKKRILVLGALHFSEELKTVGHDVLTCAIGSQVKSGPFGSSVVRGNFGDKSDLNLVPPLPMLLHTLLDLLPKGWSPDLVILGDSSIFPMIVGLEQLKVPLLWYAVDSHIHTSWHPDYAPVFDVIFVAQKEFLSPYSKDPSRQHVEWLPQFCNPHWDYDRGLDRTIDISFVGTQNKELNPSRYHFLKAIQDRIPIQIISGDYVEPYNRSKLSLNQCVGGDLNFRLFEIMSCGAMIIMERIGNGLTDLFEDRKHMALYDKDNAEQVATLFHYYSEHPEERRAIAKRGTDEVMAKHTCRHRVEKLLEVVDSLPIKEMVSKRITALKTIQSHLIKVYKQAALVHFSEELKDPNSPLGKHYSEIGQRFAKLYQMLNQTV